jgi:O-antigen/teichoic acid export membrane protein
MTNSRIDIMMTYWFVGESEAGIYSATVRICDMLVFAWIAINISIGPTLACLHYSGEINKLQAVATTAARVSTIAALPVILLVSLFSQFSMSLFGADFVGSPWPLIILCVGQAIVVLTGSKTLLLVMSGEERNTAFVLGVTAILHICVSIVLIPPLGILGAAISTALSVICWSLWLTCVSIRTLKIDPTVFNVFSTPSMTNPKN